MLANRTSHALTTAGPVDAPETAGLLLVHGIGEQRSRDTLQRFVRSFLAAEPRASVEGGGDPIAIRVGDRTVRLYEVYWADLLTGPDVRNTFDFDVLLTLPWFPGLNRRAGLYAPGDYARWLTPLRTTQLLLAAVSAVFMYWWITWAVSFPMALFRAYRARGRGDESAAGLLRRLQGWDQVRELLGPMRGRKVVRDPEMWGPGDFLVDNVAGDVVTYVASLRGALPPTSPVARRGEAILDRFHAALRAAHDDGCTEIQILAHSLGTVIAYHGLVGLGLGPCPGASTQFDPLARVTRLYTIGSPLEKVRFLWPQLVPDEPPGRLRYGGGPPCAVQLLPNSPPTIAWDNFYGRYDMVSGKLKRFGVWGEVRNHRVRRGGFLRSHTIYQRSPELMDVLVEGLTGRRRRRSVLARVLRRLWDPIVSWFENGWLSVPLMGTIVLSGIGAVASLAVIGAQAVAYLLGLAGLEGAAEILPLAAFIGVAVLTFVGLALGGRARAGEVHARYTRLRWP